MNNLKNDEKRIQTIEKYYIKIKKLIQKTKYIFDGIIKSEFDHNKIKYCIKKKSNNENKKYKLRKNIFHIIFIFLLFIKLSKEIEILFSEITITIKGSKNQKILSDSNLRIVPNPNQILLNGEIQNYTGIIVYNLIEEINNITMRWEFEITNCNYMFYNLSNITNIDLSNFNASKVTEVKSMFHGCKSLISLDLNSFNNASSLIHMSKMFRDCNSLQFIDFQNLNTSKVLTMDNLFIECSKLTSLDLHNFNTSSVTNMEFMFSGCVFIRIIKFI